MFTAPTKLEIKFGNDLDRGFVAHNRSVTKKYRSGTQGRINPFLLSKNKLKINLPPAEYSSQSIAWSLQNNDFSFM